MRALSVVLFAAALAACGESSKAIRDAGVNDDLVATLDGASPQHDGATEQPDLATNNNDDLTGVPAPDLTTPPTTIADMTPPPQDLTPTTPPSSVPTAPITFKKGEPFTTNSGTTNWVYVPKSYDSTHQTPITLFVWLHGCGGYSEGDIWSVSPGGTTQTWISMTVGGREGGCWNMSVDPARVLAAIADLKKHFNIAPKNIVLGGYSSGGDLSYRTAFYNASQFAGVLAENTSPFRDTGSSQSASLAAASWKFNVVHLAHLHDDTYPIAGVRTETNAVKNAGFPMTRIEREGTHWDDEGDVVEGMAVPGTSNDAATYLLPYLKMGWSAP